MGSFRITVTDNQIVRLLVLSCRCLQWPSAVIVLGINSYFIHNASRGLLDTYTEVISCVSVVFFVPAFISPFIQLPPIKGTVILIDIVLSYLWITAFIFMALDYDNHYCKANGPPGISCPIKFANEAFTFLTFIFTFFALFLESASLWFVKRDEYSSRPPKEKNSAFHHSDGHNGTVPVTHDGGEEPRATVAV